ncbi:hypothetical protein [Neisseria sicca]|uniref:hypothetical protein n=1 Tax=Neisseria sicca TaxID=490 RepID=UPI001FD34002|nr:hypothetical protein [Neisseria sicca]
MHVHVSVFSWKYCKQRYWFLYADSLYQFDIVLIGPVRQQLPLIAYAFGQAFKRGITKNNTMGTLEDIAVENNGYWQSVNRNNQIQPHTDNIILPAFYPADIEITFQTTLAPAAAKQHIRHQLPYHRDPTQTTGQAHIHTRHPILAELGS